MIIEKVFKKIPASVIPYAYQETKRVFESNLPIKEAAENINKNCGIKINSAVDYGYYFKYLMTGTGSCRNLNSFTQEYFLKRILEDYGMQQQNKSLQAFWDLILKFEGEKVGYKKSMRIIFEKYNK